MFKLESKPFSTNPFVFSPWCTQQTGLPKPQPDHAIIMVKFATDCMSKMNSIVCSSSLIDTLGNDTADLTMRVGLHSGPVRLFLIVRGYEYELDIFGLAAHPRIGYSSYWWKSVADVPYRSRMRTWSIWSVHHTSWSVHHTRVLISPSVAPVISCSIIIISHTGLTQQHQKRFKSIQINRMQFR